MGWESGTGSIPFSMLPAVGTLGRDFRLAPAPYSPATDPNGASLAFITAESTQMKRTAVIATRQPAGRRFVPTLPASEKDSAGVQRTDVISVTRPCNVQ